MLRAIKARLLLILRRYGELIVLNHLEKYFLLYWCMFILFCSGLFLGSEIRLMQMDKAHDHYTNYLDGIVSECNDKIAKARGLK